MYSIIILDQTKCFLVLLIELPTDSLISHAFKDKFFVWFIRVLDFFSFFSPDTVNQGGSIKGTRTYQKVSGEMLSCRKFAESSWGWFNKFFVIYNTIFMCNLKIYQRFSVEITGPLHGPPGFKNKIRLNANITTFFWLKSPRTRP